MISLGELNKRLSKLENPIGTTLSSTTTNTSPTGFLSTVEHFFLDEKTKILDEVKTVLHKEFDALTSKPGTICNVVDFVVGFVEKVVILVPKVVLLVGGLFTGHFKLSLAIELIHELIPDIESILPASLLPDLINHTVSLKYNQVKNSDGTTSTNIQQSKTIETDGSIGTSTSDSSTIPTPVPRPKKKVLKLFQ